MGIKYFDGNVKNPKVYADIDEDLKNSVNTLKDKVDQKIEELKINEALEEIFDVLRKCNKYIDDTTPWVLAKDEENKIRLETILYNLLEAIRVCATILQAFIPETADKIFKGLKIDNNNFDDIYESVTEYQLGSEKPANLFERIKEE